MSDDQEVSRSYIVWHVVGLLILSTGVIIALSYLLTRGFSIRHSWLIVNIVTLVVIGLGLNLPLYIIYMHRNKILRREVSSLSNLVSKCGTEIGYVHKQFDEHFKTTSTTIEDLRKERNYWKERALKKKPS